MEGRGGDLEVVAELVRRLGYGEFGRRAAVVVVACVGEGVVEVELSEGVSDAVGCAELTVGVLVGRCAVEDAASGLVMRPVVAESAVDRVGGGLDAVAPGVLCGCGEQVKVCAVELRDAFPRFESKTLGDLLHEGGRLTVVHAGSVPQRGAWP